MSSVYSALDRVLERHVAIKLLHEQFASDESAVERFRREATSVAQLAHPNVVGVIDRGEDGRRQFIVFELVDGPNLKEVVRTDGPLPVADALAYAAQAGRALGFAHAQGLVHRDVKPQNILLAPDGSVKVTDFGIARTAALDGLTQTGTVLGTSEYVAPEQARGETVGPATDIYALGVVLYELLAGAPPYSGEGFVDIALRHVNDPVPSIRARRPDVPWRVDTAVARAMAKKPADRFASMDAMVAELEACAAALAAPGVGDDAPPAAQAVPGDDGLTVAADALTSISPALGGAPAGGGPGGPGGSGGPGGRAPDRPRRARWPLVAGLGGLVVAAVVAMAVATLGDDGGKGGGGGAAVTLRAVGTYDPPPGDGKEHDDEVGLATDGDAATAWRTETYRAALDVIGKKGVGLVLDAGAAVAPGKLVVVTDTPGFTAQLLAGDAQGGPFAPASAEETVAARAELAVDGAAGKHRYWVVWITKLAGDSAHLNEVTAG